MGGEYSLCSRFDDITYDPVLYQPSAYVRVVRQQHMRELMAAQAHLPKVENTDEMTIDELRAYYDRGGANRVAAMDASAQEDLFKKFLVSSPVIWAHANHLVREPGVPKQATAEPGAQKHSDCEATCEL